VGAPAAENDTPTTAAPLVAGGLTGGEGAATD